MPPRWPWKAENPRHLEGTLGGITRLYGQSLQEHGLTSKGVGWKDEASQRLRFEKLSQVIDLRAIEAGITINDWGCGYGAMFHYLDQLLGAGLIRYYGYDISEEMLSAASSSIRDPRAEWVKASEVTQEADYSFVSGTFNVRMEAGERLWTGYIKEQLRKLASHSVRGFAFNLLTIHVDWKQADLYYGDPMEFFHYCRQEISRYVSLLHDYPLYEWTMIVRKEVEAG
jgi:SAM-dependent methyltransferase